MLLQPLLQLFFARHRWLVSRLYPLSKRGWQRWNKPRAANQRDESALSAEEAARAAGIGVRTLLRWLKLPEFQSSYRQARRDVFGQAIARLQQGTSPAATTLLKIMIDPSVPASVVPASVRVRAADSVHPCLWNRSFLLNPVKARMGCRGRGLLRQTPDVRHIPSGNPT